jgi:hypothetical protein
MRLADARIGWSSYSADFSAPGDRRRFAVYARERGLEYEQARIDRPYDLVLITHHSDLPTWIDRKRREGDRLKLVFELIDSYLSEPSTLRRILKGPLRFATGVDSSISFDFTKTLTEACSVADAVICATPEQQQAVLPFNRSAFISFDWFDDEIGEPKAEYQAGPKLNLVWEGQSSTVRHLHLIRDVLSGFAGRVQLHVVSDPLVPRALGRFRFPIHRALEGLSYEFRPWRRDTFAQDVKAADVAVIPIDPHDAFALGKPENKLIMFWKMGMPVLVSSTPAYDRAMSGAGLDLTCRNESDWRTKLQGLLDASAGERREIGRSGRRYAEQDYSIGQFMKPFDDAFASVGFAV